MFCDLRGESNVFRSSECVQGLCVSKQDVQKEIRSALMTESAKVSEIAAKHGFSFTSDEAEQAWETAKDNELSDFELDMVAGGVTEECS